MQHVRNRPGDLRMEPAGEAAAVIDVWVCRFDGGLAPSVRDRCNAILTTEERERISRFYHQDRGDQALVARALSRRTLSWRFGGAPEAWRFGVADKGRPYALGGDCDVDFNISHTDGCVVCAVTDGARVGVDVERVARADEIIDVAPRVFSAAEQQSLNRLDAHKYKDAPVRLWTLKEAYSKAIGEGLGFDFRTLGFHFDERFSNVSLRNGNGEWRFLTEPVDGEFILSLAYKVAVRRATIVRRDATKIL